MVYSLIYVSNTSKVLKKEGIEQVFDYTTAFNINHDISGFLVYKDGNFIQLREGNEKRSNLYISEFLRTSAM